MSNPTVYGSGLIGSAFQRSPITDPGICIFASGVSNSSCKDSSEYLRETKLLQKALLECRQLVYFSSYAIADPGLMLRPYFQHKAEVERMLIRSAKALIIRLPNVVGPTPNPHTFVGYLHNHIVQGTRPLLWENALRYLIWVEDVVIIVKEILKQKPHHDQVYWVGPTHSYSPLEVFAKLCLLQNAPLQYDMERGDSLPYKVEDPRVQDIVRKSKVFPDDKDTYLHRLISLYVNAVNPQR